MDLDEERKQKSSAVAAKKKIEMDFTDMESHLEAAIKAKEDAYKQLKKSQVRYYIYFRLQTCKRHIQLSRLFTI